MDIDAIAEKAQNIQDREAATDPNIRKVLGIVKHFIQANRVLCYGGTAINNLLPEKERFYDPNYDIPDYDFYSQTPQIHAMKLADQFSAEGFKSVEVKPGSHLLTFKVFVDFTGVADITFLDEHIFDKQWNEKMVVDKIHYVTPNFLRMSMYLELSRPRGDVSRWTKVYKRLMLLNQYYPISCSKKKETFRELSDSLRSTVESLLVNKPAILLGIHAIDLHSKSKRNIWELPIDILVEPANFDDYVKNMSEVFPDSKVVETPAYAELVPKHTDILSEDDSLIARVFETTACQSYHELKNGMKVASIPTLLNFFFSFLYADKHFLEGFDENRIICIAQRLMDLAHSSKQRRFQLLTPIECLGHQETLTEIKAHTASLRTALKTKEDMFLKFFFTYNPSQLTGTKKTTLKKQLRKTLKSI